MTIEKLFEKTGHEGTLRHRKKRRANTERERERNRNQIIFYREKKAERDRK